MCVQGPAADRAQLRDSGPLLHAAAALPGPGPLRRVHRLRGALPHHTCHEIRGLQSEGEC